MWENVRLMIDILATHHKHISTTQCTLQKNLNNLNSPSKNFYNHFYTSHHLLILHTVSFATGTDAPVHFNVYCVDTIDLVSTHITNALQLCSRM